VGARRGPDAGVRHGGMCGGSVCGSKGAHWRAVTITLPGGDLLIDWDKRDHILMTGAVAHEFEGYLPDIEAVS
jgi:diaminopimelate epimerase